MTTFAPLLASSRAIARPIPREAPVITAVFPSRFMPSPRLKQCSGVIIPRMAGLWPELAPAFTRSICRQGRRHQEGGWHAGGQPPRQVSLEILAPAGVKVFQDLLAGHGI